MNYRERLKIGEKVKTIRLHERKTQEKFAEELNLSADSIKRIESGENVLTPKNAYEIATRYNVSLDWLLGLNVNAKSIHFALQNKLKIISHIKPIDSSLFPEGERSLILQIDGHLLDFLISLSNAEKDKQVPQLFNESIQNCEQKYNYELKKGECFDPFIYRLQSPDEKILKMLDGDGNVKDTHYIE